MTSYKAKTFQDPDIFFTAVIKSALCTEQAMIKSALCTEKALCFVVPVLQTSRGVEGAVFCGTGASDQQRCGRRCVSGYQCFRPAEVWKALKCKSSGTFPHPYAPARWFCSAVLRLLPSANGQTQPRNPQDVRGRTSSRRDRLRVRVRLTLTSLCQAVSGAEV